MDKQRNLITRKHLNAYRKCRAYSDLVVPFINQCDDPYVKQLMILRYVKRKTWEGVSVMIGYGNANSCRMEVTRYLKKQDKQNVLS